MAGTVPAAVRCAVRGGIKCVERLWCEKALLFRRQQPRVSPDDTRFQTHFPVSSVRVVLLWKSERNLYQRSAISALDPPFNFLRRLITILFARHHPTRAACVNGLAPLFTSTSLQEKLMLKGEVYSTELGKECRN